MPTNTNTNTAPLFLEHNGVKVYHATKGGNAQFYWYSTSPTRPSGGRLHEKDFDVRELPPVPGKDAKATYIDAMNRPDHEAIIRSAIDAKVIR